VIGWIVIVRALPALLLSNNPNGRIQASVQLVMDFLMDFAIANIAFPAD
jgi:hypothetical protein